MKTIIILLAVVIGFSSCSKEGTGGNATIKGEVRHHDEKIKNAVIHIAYGATELPGEHDSDYDDSQTSGSDAKFEFTGLKEGNYYIYATGHDDAIDEHVMGGIPVVIESDDSKIEINIPVTEGAHSH